MQEYYESIIINFIKEKKKISPKQCARILKVPYSHVLMILHNMVTKELIDNDEKSVYYIKNIARK